MLHLYYVTALIGMVQVWEVKLLRSVCDMKVNKSEHVTKYFLPHILSVLGPSFDPNSSFGLTMGLVSFGFFKVKGVCFALFTLKF